MSIEPSPAGSPPTLTGAQAATLSGGRVCAVCVTYHPDEQLPQRLAAVRPQVAHLVVVDNGSSAEARAMLGEIGRWPGVSVIFCDENLGSARGLNLGVEQAQRLGCEFALLLDQDTRANDDLVPVLTAIHRTHPSRDRLALVGAGYASAHEAPDASAGSELAYREVEAVIASGSLLWLPAFEAIGPFRDEFFIDLVDNEFCARAYRHGFQVVKARRTLMVHVIGNPQERRHPVTYFPHYPADRLYYQARNDTVMLRESGRYRTGAWQLKSFARTFRRCKRVLQFERDDRANKIRSLAQGWYDGLRGRLGKRPGTRPSR